MNKEIIQKVEPNSSDFSTFSKEARSVLEQQGLFICALRGVSVFELKQQGANIYSNDLPITYFQNYHPGQLSQPSRKSEVAFFEDEFILEETKFASSYIDQLSILFNYYKENAFFRKINKYGLDFYIGSVADYTDLILNYYAITGKYLISPTQGLISLQLNTSSYCGQYKKGSDSFSNFFSIRATLKNPDKQKEEYGVIINECCHCHNVIGKGLSPLLVSK